MPMQSQAYVIDGKILNLNQIAQLTWEVVEPPSGMPYSTSYQIHGQFFGEDSYLHANIYLQGLEAHHRQFAPKTDLNERVGPPRERTPQPEVRMPDLMVKNEVALLRDLLTDMHDQLVQKDKLIAELKNMVDVKNKTLSIAIHHERTAIDRASLLEAQLRDTNARLEALDLKAIEQRRALDDLTKQLIYRAQSSGSAANTKGVIFQKGPPMEQVPISSKVSSSEEPLPSFGLPRQES